MASTQPNARVRQRFAMPMEAEADKDNSHDDDVEEGYLLGMGSRPLQRSCVRTCHILSKKYFFSQNQTLVLHAEAPAASHWTHTSGEAPCMFKKI